MHSSQMPVKCELCGREFVLQNHLESHLRRKTPCTLVTAKPKRAKPVATPAASPPASLGGTTVTVGGAVIPVGQRAVNERTITTVTNNYRTTHRNVEITIAPLGPDIDPMEMVDICINSTELAQINERLEAVSATFLKRASNGIFLVIVDKSPTEVTDKIEHPELLDNLKTPDELQELALGAYRAAVERRQAAGGPNL